MALQRDSGKLSEPKAIEPALAAEAGKAGFASRLRPAKETPIGFVQALQRRALKVRRQIREVGIVPPYLRQTLVLINTGNGPAGFPISANALFIFFNIVSQGNH